MFSILHALGMFVADQFKSFGGVVFRLKTCSYGTNLMLLCEEHRLVFACAAEIGRCSYG